MTQVFAEGDAFGDGDAVSRVTDSLVEAERPEPAGAAPDGTEQASAWRHLGQDFRPRPAS